MFNAIIRLSLRYRLLVVLTSIVVLLYGTYLSTTMPIDVLPDLDRPRVVLLTEAPGMAPEDVETLITQHLETAVLGSTGVQDVRSNSLPELSLVYVEFDWGTDIRHARQTVQERLATLEGVLPAGIKPVMTPTSSIMGQIVIAGLYRQAGPTGGELTAIPQSPYLAELVSEKRLRVWEVTDRHAPKSWKEVPARDVEWRKERTASFTIEGKEHEVTFPSFLQQQMALRTFADWVIRPRLRKIPGVAEVFVMGGEERQYHVLVDPAALNEFDISLHEIERAIRDHNLSTSGGFAVDRDTERPIRVLGRMGPEPRKVLDELGKVPLKANAKRPVLIDQVAAVVEGAKFKRGDAGINGYPGVVLTIAKQPHVDTRAITEELTRALQDLEASLPADVVVNPNLFQLKSFIDRGIFNVGEALVLGAGLVVIVLFLFLLNFRTTFITLTAIPLSLVTTVIVFHVIEWLTGTPLSINVMTLGGLAVAMGELVDDAIVDVENIFRRLRENRHAPNPQPVLRVVYRASLEVRGAIVFGTAVIILVFLPLFALSGIEGRLFTPLAIAYIVSILASLLVSLTLTPVLSYYLLPRARATEHDRDGWLLRLLKRLATPLIRLSMARAGLLLVGTWVLVGVCVFLLTRLGADFLPPFDEGSVQVNIALPPGSSLQATSDAARVVDNVFRKMQKSPDNPNGEILQFVRRTGRAALDEHAMPVSGSEYILNINPESGQDREEILAGLLEDLKRELPGVDVEVEQPLAHLISHMISGVTAQVAIKVYGDDLDTLQRTAQRIKSAIEDIEGVTPPVVEPVRHADELHIYPRPDDLALYCVSKAHVADFVQTALQGKVATQVIDGQRRFDVVVRLKEETRTDYGNLGRLRLDLPDQNRHVLLSELADVGPGQGPNLINRENARRRIVIRCNAQGRDLASVVGEIQERVRTEVDLPEGYFVEYGGQFESQRRATTLIAVLALVSVAGMFLVLLMLFPSKLVCLQILNAIPTAFIGGVLALVITRQSLTVASMVGFISLGGIAVRNGILLVTHYIHLMKKEGEGFTPQMILRGSLERLAPVLMTALTALFALLPLVLGGQQPGREILYPVATVILGGLITSTLCEFLIHPGLFWRFSGRDHEKIIAQADDAEVVPT